MLFHYGTYNAFTLLHVAYCRIRVLMILKMPLDPFGYILLYSESKKKVLYSVFNVYLYVIDPALYHLNHKTYVNQIHTKHEFWTNIKYAPQIILKSIF